MRKERPNVAVLHIQKTAGTSLLKLIERSYPPENIFRWYAEKQLPEGKCRARHEHILIGHFHYGVQDSVFDECDMVTLLRNPIERTISQLYFMRRTFLKREDAAASRHKAWFQRNESPIGFMKRSKRWQLDNAMVRMLSGVRDEVPYGELKQHHLNAAMDNLSKFAYVGFQENFGNDIKNLSRLYGWRRIGLPRNIRRDNQHIDSSQRRELIKRNHLDLALYQHAIGVRADRLKELGIQDSWQSREKRWLRPAAENINRLRYVLSMIERMSGRRN
jgi:hypothetical protein